MTLVPFLMLRNSKVFFHYIFQLLLQLNQVNGIATGYGLDDQFDSRWRHEFSLLHIVQTGSGVHPTSYKNGYRGFFPGVKRQGREADHSPPTSAEVKKMWFYTSTPPYFFMA
jgi:hypothetical protein